jgi:uncharacterized protein (TIGR02284 family)
MATMVGKQKDIAALLNALIELDLDAVEAYDAAIKRLKDNDDKRNLSLFMGDHERHVRELQPFVEELGEKAAQKADVKQVLTKGKVVLAGLVGDRLIMMAMKTNEDDTNTAYERASTRDDLPAHVKAVLVRNLDDERRHREYILRRLQAYEGKDVSAPTSDVRR